MSPFGTKGRGYLEGYKYAFLSILALFLWLFAQLKELD